MKDFQLPWNVFKKIFKKKNYYEIFKRKAKECLTNLEKTIFLINLGTNHIEYNWQIITKKVSANILKMSVRKLDISITSKQSFVSF